MILYGNHNLLGARGSVAGWGLMLQTEGRSSIPVEATEFFNLPNTSSFTMALMLTQHLTEMNTRD
jgi:hypothetical protein